MAVTSVAPMDCSNHGGFASCSSDPDCEMLCISYQVNGQIRNFCYPHAMNPEQGICAPNRYITRFQYQPDTDEYCLQVKECGASEWTTIECAPSEAFNPADVRVPYIGRDGEPTSVPLVANPRVVRVRPNMNNDSGTSSLSPDYVIGPSLYHPSDALRIINDDLVGSEVVILQQGVELDRRVNSPGTFTDIAYGRNGAANSGEMLGFPPLVPAQVPDGGGESIIHCYVDEVYDARLDKTVFEYKCYTCGQQGMVYSTVIEEGYTFGVTFIRNIPATATFKYVLNKVTRPIFDMCQAYGSRLAQSNPSSQDTTLQSDRAAIMNETASPVKAFPNPFTTSLQVDYTLESDDVVSIQVFDLLGNEVMEVKANEAQTAGFHTLLITGADWPQGIYLVKMQFKNHPLVTKRVYKTK
ncbi:MAG: T9SS type A sorting domain-containing protein [Thermonemataceae bacterium]